jgi:hypothetical protein
MVPAGAVLLATVRDRVSAFEKVASLKIGAVSHREALGFSGRAWIPALVKGRRASALERRPRPPSSPYPDRPYFPPPAPPSSP